MNTRSQLQWKIKSPVGTLYLVASDAGLEGIFTEKPAAKILKTLKEETFAEKTLAKTSRQLDEYFAGKRTEFELPLHIEGTAFQKQVWAQLQKIPYGKTWAYRDLAKKIKNEKAVRAVGTANGCNPFPIVIPCHRVIAANGSLGGYSGGLPMKIKLLQLEGRSF